VLPPPLPDTWHINRTVGNVVRPGGIVVRHRHHCFPFALTIARIFALVGSDSEGHASTTVCKSAQADNPGTM